MKRLPRSLDDIRGLGAARWIRESTAAQYDRFGPASQREQQDRFIERYGLVDTGRVFQVAHSGTTVWRSPTMTQMLAEAKAGGFDLLLAGYSDRWQRNLRRTLELLEDHLHPAGVALVMCDRRIISSDPNDWDELVAESAGAEKYSRRLSERITEGYAAKFAQENDPGGHAASRLPAISRAAQHPPDRPGDDRRSGEPLRALRPGHPQRPAACRRDRPGSLAHPLHPDEPDLQRLDQETPRTQRDAQASSLALQPSGLRRAVGQSRGSPTGQVPGQRTASSRSGGSARRSRSTASVAGASAATAGPPTGATASSIPSRARRGVRPLGCLPRHGRSRSSPRSAASSSTTG